MAVQISKKRKFVADGIFKAELNEFLTRELAEDGYSGVEVRVTPTRTEIIILATRTQNVLGEKGRRIRELTAVVQKRFGFPEGSVELYAEKVATRGLCAIAQAESLRYKLLGGLAVRRCTWNQSQNYAAMGPKWKDWPQKASSRSCQHCGTQRRDLAHHSHFRAERWQTRTASHAAASSHCLRALQPSPTRGRPVPAWHPASLSRALRDRPGPGLWSKCHYFHAIRRRLSSSMAFQAVATGSARWTSCDRRQQRFNI
uniref:Ribosomal protein S3 n=1 Tax=Meleagris gallopavo TaxID=9103 RepID=A0A803Y7Z9_MELGA